MDFLFVHNFDGFMMKGYTVLEKLSHLFHMHSIWIKANSYYKKLVASPKPEIVQICNCVNDINLNGIGQAMEIAHTILSGNGKGQDVGDDCFWWHMKQGNLSI
jgi:hypothetical protein